MSLVKNMGVEVVLDGETFVLPPIALGPLRALQDRLKKLSESTDPLSPESLECVIDVALASLKRNYPEMTRERVAELVDLGNMDTILRAVMDVSGMLRKAQEQEKATGKSEAANP